MTLPGLRLGLRVTALSTTMVVVDGFPLRLQRGTFTFITVEGNFIFGLKWETWKIVARIQGCFGKTYGRVCTSERIHQPFATET